jgi:uncharacterized membrane protein YbhN (UPF0104 family)
VRDAAADAAAGLEGALAGLADAVAGAAPGWLLLGVLLHLLNQVARGRGWFSIVRAACDADLALRRRDAIAAWIAGAGAGGVVSARGGDAVRVLLLARRADRADCPLLAGTLVAESAGETAVGAALLALAIAVGVGPQLGVPVTTVVAAAVLAAAAIVAARAWRARRARDRAARPAGDFGPATAGDPGPATAGGLARDHRQTSAGDRVRFARLRRIARRVACGCAVLRTPRAYARSVLPWQLASRACRFGALACFLAAFGLPATPVAVLLVAFAQGSARLLPFAPASVGAGVAVLAASFGPVTGTAVPAGDLVAFFVGTSTVLTVVGTVLALAICLRFVRWRGVLDVVRLVRRTPVRV